MQNFKHRTPVTGVGLHCTTVHAEANTMRLKHSFYHSYETKRNVENKSRVLLNSASKMQHIFWASIATLLHISYTQLSNSVILQMIFASYSIFDSSTPILFFVYWNVASFFWCPFFWLSVVGLDSTMCSLLSSFNTFFYIIKVCWKKGSQWIEWKKALHFALN